MSPGPPVSLPVERRPFASEVRPDGPIRGDLWQPEGAVIDSAIVLCHGFRGVEDREGVARTAEHFRRHVATDEG